MARQLIIKALKYFEDVIWVHVKITESNSQLRHNFEVAHIMARVECSLYKHIVNESKNCR